LHLVEFNSTGLGPGRKNNCLQKETVPPLGQQMVWQLQEAWALQVDVFHQFCPSREGTQQYLLGLQQV
jgi:hypothetical protein